ncbi:SWF or SNF family helicase [Streptomyces sp. SID14515]|uniref:SWIM zinc finger family protein n=1 Tax=Streptomyces sp. SID14515 TaxID=2706074 RepID=UPI0013C73709|nr:SWF or SNF family helicase [Streptomyces sp. SID14515]NEB37626.1 SWF or SNF family helicase [Streptomyces sp. SID14515]
MSDAYEDDYAYADDDGYGAESGAGGADASDRGDDGDGASRDGRRGPERTFAAFPPAQGRGFATSWWGRAWLKALEDTALDGQQLKQGRRLAREGRVGAVSVRPGRITAVVRDRDGTAYRSDVLLQQLGAGAWDRFLDMAVDRAGHIAALLDREMPPHLVEDAASAGVDLLPGIGDLEPECTCGAWDHCPHSGALCYQVARLLDEDPFVLLLMRGRDERRLLDELQVRSAARAVRAGDGGAQADDIEEREVHGVPAGEAFAAAGILPPLPAPPSAPEEPGLGPSLDTETGPVPGIDPAALEVLAADSAVRARRMLLDALAPGHEGQPLPVELTPQQDAVRLVADARPEPRFGARLATGSGRPPAELDAAVRAWRYGGVAALAVLDEEWTPDPEQLGRARARLGEAWEAGERPTLRASGRAGWTVVGADVQLRFDPNGRWWPYRKEHGRWVPAGPADDDPAGALAGAEGGAAEATGAADAAV